jgi:hypothetical protein
VERENIGAAVIGVFMPVKGPELADEIRASHSNMPAVFVALARLLPEHWPRHEELGAEWLRYPSE